MDRPIVYPGSIPQDTDLLKTNQNAMVALGFLAQVTLGTGTVADGLACSPTTPASMAVLVGPGSIYGLQNLEATSYGSLPADTADQVVKQGIVLGNTTFNCPAPATSGQSVVYLVQAEYQDVDGGSIVLPYYNAANPSVPYSGPANSGTPQDTIRQGKCVLALKAGTAATTGTQATPTPDAGYAGLWAITVANGASTITGGNIAQYPGAPFIGTKLPGRISGVSLRQFSAAGSYTYTPAAGMKFALAVLTGGGGGGGGGFDGTGSAGSGGSGGGTAIALLTASQVGPSQAVTVGAGGAGGAHSASSPSNGTMGGTSSLGSIISAAGGTGGGAASNSNAAASYPGGVGSGGLLNLAGGSGGNGFGVASTSGFTFGGAGGGSLWGGGGNGRSASSTSTAGANGGGGGGGMGAFSGSNGGDGVLLLLEFLSQ